MSVLATTITSTAQTTFSSIPNGVTPATGDNSTKLATTAYVQSNIALINPVPLLTTNTNQTLTGSAGLSFANQQAITNIDTIALGDTLLVGETADSNIVIGQSASPCQLYIKTFLQPITNIWKFWGNGSVNTTVASGVAVECKKALSGSFTLTSNSTPVVFSPAFVSKPVVIVSLRSTGSIVGLTQNKWVESVDRFGFIARSAGTNSNIEYNWLAIGN
jgi:hypothetical protein